MSRLKEARIKSGLSQSQLTEKAGIKLRTLQHYEQGIRDVDGAKLDTLIDITDALGCKISDIINDEKLVDKCKKLGI